MSTARYSSELSSLGPLMISGVRASSTRIEFDLVDDGVMVPALHHGLERMAHVVAQIVEAELVVGAVGDVAGIGVAALRVVQAGHDHAHAQAEEPVDGPIQPASRRAR